MSLFHDIGSRKPPAQEGASAYMVQLSNSSLQNGLINRAQLIRALKINLLFFEEAHVSAPALLRNDVLNELSLEASEREALARIYREFLRPVLIDRSGNIEKVADAIARSNLNIGFHRKKGRGSPIVDKQSFEKNDFDAIWKHAEFIKSCKPTYRYTRRNFEQRDFLEAYLRTVAWYASISKGVQKELFSDLERRLATESCHRSNFRVVDVIDVLDRTRSQIGRYPVRMYTQACSLAFLTMEWLAAPSEGQEFSASEKASYLIDEIENAHFKSALDGDSEGVAKSKPSSLIVKFPIEKLLHLPLHEVLKVRDMTLFRELRVGLARHRRRTLSEPGHAGGIDEDAELLGLYFKAGEFLSEYLSQDDLRRQFTRENYQQEWEHVVLMGRYGYSPTAIMAVAAEATAIALVRAEGAGWDTWVKLAVASVVPIIGFALHRSEWREKKRKLLPPRSPTENRGNWDIVRGRGYTKRPIKKSHD